MTFLSIYLPVMLVEVHQCCQPSWTKCLQSVPCVSHLELSFCFQTMYQERYLSTKTDTKNTLVLKIIILDSMGKRFAHLQGLIRVMSWSNILTHSQLKKTLIGKNVNVIIISLSFLSSTFPMQSIFNPLFILLHFY